MFPAGKRDGRIVQPGKGETKSPDGYTLQKGFTFRGKFRCFPAPTPGFDSLKELWAGFLLLCIMRYFQSAVVLVLALGPAMQSFARTSRVRHHSHHVEVAHHYHRTVHSYHSPHPKYGSKVKEHHETARRTRIVPTGADSARASVKLHREEYKSAHSRRIAEHLTRRRETERAETQSLNVAEMIPPIPMRDGHLYVPPPLRGSLASLLRQNRRDEAEGLKRIQNTAQLNEMRRDGKLVPLPVSAQLLANPNLPWDRRCTRPWTAVFLENLAHAHYVRFHRSLEVNSAVRTVQFQRRLMRINGNAAPATGEIASPHEMGATIDIGKKHMSLSEIAWMRAYLLPLEEEGKIDVEEEFYQACFHITVYKSYVGDAVPLRRHRSEALLASRMR